MNEFENALEKIAEAAFSDELEKIAKLSKVERRANKKAYKSDWKTTKKDKNKGRGMSTLSTLGGYGAGFGVAHGINRLVPNSRLAAAAGLGSFITAGVMGGKLYKNNSKSDHAKAYRSLQARKKARKNGTALPKLFRGAKANS